MDLDCEISIGPDGRELKGHGTPAFPCGFSSYDPSTVEFPLHWHDELEFVYVRSGRVVYVIGGERYVLQEGDAAYVNSGIPHAEYSYLGTPALEGNLECDPRLLCEDRRMSLWTHYLGPLFHSASIPGMPLMGRGPAWQQEAVSLIRRAHEALTLGEEFHEVVVRESLTRVCLLIWKYSGLLDAPPQVPTVATERVKQMILYLREHFAEHITIEELASVASVSPRECQREFKAVIGESPLSYLNGYRIEMAAKMLVSTSDSVADIAAACGMPNQSYFTKRFREVYRHSPTQHRRQG